MPKINAPLKKQVNFRLGTLSRRQLNELSKRLELTKSEVVAMALDHLMIDTGGTDRDEETTNRPPERTG